MAINEDLETLINKYVAGDEQEVHREILYILEKQTYLKTKYAAWARKCKAQLKGKFTELDIPEEIKTKLYIEKQVKFNENRFLIDDRTKKLVDGILLKEKTLEKMEKLDIKVLNSILLYGLPGTGKTTLAQYIAYKLQLPFCYLNITTCIDSLLGKTGKNLDLVFNFINNNKCVFMIDELDAIGGSRENKGDSKEINRVVIALMQLLDRANNSIIIAATNREDILDPALKRRFAIKFSTMYLQSKEIELMVHNYLQDINFTYNQEQLEKWALQHTKNSQAEIINLLNSKIIGAVAQDKTSIEFL